MTPLHQAVVDNDLESVLRLKELKWFDQPDENGFSPLELAQLLGRRQCQEILGKKESISIKVQFQNQRFPFTLNRDEFEKEFNTIYRPFLTFPSYECLEEVISNCSYLLQLDAWFFQNVEEEVTYRTKLSEGLVADTFIKWISPILGYGLFAAVDLLPQTFIGEYTGLIHRLSQKNLSHHAYCLHYPTRFWSHKYFVIDSLNEGNITRFINHHTHPNLQPLWLVHHKILHLIFLTKHFIHKGTELTFDYGNDYWIHRKKVFR